MKPTPSTLCSIYSDSHPNVDVTNAAAADPTSARDRLKVRMDSGEPPDSFQAISGVDLMSWVDQGKMSSISDLAEDNNWNDVFPPAVLDILSKDGELYAIPANIERDNNLYYNMKVLEDAGLDPPETLDDFYSACETLQGEGITPLSVPAAGWVLALVGFENLMPAVLGGDYYTDFFQGNADLSGDEMETFFAEFAKVLECSNVADDEDNWNRWDTHADTLYRGESAMYVMGDWAKGYLESGKDWEGNDVTPFEANEDFGVVPGLGSSGFFTFNSAVFGLPSGALHPNAAKAFLTVMASKDGQEAFNPVKGSVPARTDADLELFDDMVKGAVADFQTAADGDNKLLAGYASLTTFDYQVEVNPSLLVFAVGGERARELDPDNVPESEESIAALDVDYIVGKMQVSYAILQD